MIILYHSVIPAHSPLERWSAGQAITLDVFKRHISWLANHYRIVSLTEYLAAPQKNGGNHRKIIAVTFDDGYKITYQCVSPFLKKKNISATFFVTTGHLEHGRLLWFSYLKALCFEKLYKTIEVKQKIFSLQSMKGCKQALHALTVLAGSSSDPVGFCETLAEKYPIMPEVAARYEGMTHGQLLDASKRDHIDVGAHTLTHPFLNQMSKDRQVKEILDSRRILADISEIPIRYFAYPGGEYNLESLELVKAAGYEAAFATIPKNLGIDPQFEIGRVGIYSCSLFKLKLKAMGVADLMRRIGLRVG